MSLWRIICGVLAALALLNGPPAQAQSSEKRIALVIGNGAYADGALATPANDAGLIAQTLQAAGFDVVGARDLDTGTLRSTFREFLDKASASGPETVAFVYYAGQGLQFEGENYLVPVDARIARDADVPLAAIRLSDLVKPLATLPLKARIVVLDAARANAFARAGQPLAGGLALMQPDPGSLIAFNSAPGTIAPEGKDYSAYATALSEMIKEGGLPLEDLFERVRLRTSELTGGAEIPWHVSKVQAPFLFFERTSAAPAAQSRFLDLRDKPIRDFDARDAYLAALARDSMRGYEDFLAAYPGDPLAKRVRAIVAARREAIVWRESAIADTPDAYWSYLRRYPRGPHAGDAHRRLTHFAVAFEPPAAFTALSYDVPPPPPDEIVYVERPVVYFADPVYELPPPPPVPVIFLPPRPVYYVDLPPPPPPIAAFVLPIPIYHPVPVWVERPAYVVPPPVNIINVNIHNTVVVNPATQSVVVTNPQGRPEPPLPPALMGNPQAPAIPVPQPGQPGIVAGAQQLIQQHPAAAAAIAATAAALPAAAMLRARQQQTRPQQGAAPSAPMVQPGMPAGSGQIRPGQPPQARQPTTAAPAIGAPAGARPLPVPGTLPAVPGNAAPAQRLATPPNALQPNRPVPPPVANAPRGAPQGPAAAGPAPGSRAPAAAPRMATPQPAQAPQRAAAEAARQAAAQRAAQQRAQQTGALQVQQQRAAQQRAMQAQQQAQQRAAMQAQAAQQRQAQQRAMQAQQQAGQRAAMQAQAAQQRQAQQRSQMMARPHAPQPARGPQPQHQRCQPNQPFCR
ncbi:caspase domain-containing protein [Bosea sp. ASV33]|uniref:caspase family protein n=1 Tax=Bosea sp. ASV33 TaxID=2795106 RepID=UPI0018EBC86A|nr:caspase domain-containing protein [Bosea sp. ASV33]